MRRISFFFFLARENGELASGVVVGGGVLGVVVDWGGEGREEEKEEGKKEEERQGEEEQERRERERERERGRRKGKNKRGSRRKRDFEKKRERERERKMLPEELQPPPFLNVSWGEWKKQMPTPLKKDLEMYLRYGFVLFFLFVSLSFLFYSFKCASTSSPTHSPQRETH